MNAVSVADRLDGKRRYYAAVLTYFYRRSDLQMGEYEREFAQKVAAQEWVKQFKGRQVMVHVNPKNPADSFLLDSDLDGLDLHLEPRAQERARLELPPVLSHRYRFFSALGEQLSIVGLAGSAVVLAMSIATGGKSYSWWLLWTGGAMLAIAFLSMIVLTIHLEDDDKATYFLRTYKVWTPAWMRWSLKYFDNCLCCFWCIDLPPDSICLIRILGSKSLTPHLPCIFGCWGFLLCASFLTAVQRSQEQAGLSAK